MSDWNPDARPKPLKGVCAKCGQDILQEGGYWVVVTETGAQAPDGHYHYPLDSDGSHVVPDGWVHYKDCSRYNWHDPAAECDGASCHRAHSDGDAGA